jgi:hypothetical protein
LWTYVDPSTTQGVFTGVVLFFVAVGGLVLFKVFGRWAGEEARCDEE